MTQLDPSTVFSLLYAEAAYAGAPWGTLGTSGADPTTGTAVDSRSPAVFTAASGNSLVNASSTSATFKAATTNEISGYVLFYGTSTPTPFGANYADGNLIGDSGNANVNVGFTTSGFGVSLVYDSDGNSTGDAYSRSDVAVPPNQWAYAQFYTAAGVLWIRVSTNGSSGTWTSFPFNTANGTSFCEVSSGTLLVGKAFGSGSNFDGRILSVGGKSSATSQGTFDGIGEWLQARYPSINIGFGATSAGPTVGTPPVNNHFPSDFDGATQYLQGEALSTYLTSGAWSFGFLAKVRAAPSDPGSGARNSIACLMSDTNNAISIAFTASGVTIEVRDGSHSPSSLTVACSINVWHYIQAYWDGTNLGLRVDNGAWSTLAYYNASALTGLLQYASNYNATAFLNAQVLELQTANFALSNAEFETNRLDLQSIYELTLGTAGFTLGLAGLASRARQGRDQVLTAVTLGVSGARDRSIQGRLLVQPAITVFPSGLRSPSREGSLIVLPNATVAPSGLAARSREGALQTLPLVILPTSGIRAPSREGRLVVQPSNTLSPAGLRSATRQGSLVASPAVTLSPSGLAARSREGRLVVTPSTTLAVPGARAPVRVGSEQTLTFVTLGVSGLRARTLAGLVQTQFGGIISSLSGLRATARDGAIAVSATYTVAPSGIASRARLGSEQTLPSYIASPKGVPARARLGSEQVAPGSVTLTVAGLGSRAREGSVSLSTFVTLQPSGLASRAREGAVSTTAAYTLGLAGLASRAREGRAVVQPTNVLGLSGVAARAREGSVTVIPSAVAIALSGLAGRSRVGLVTASTIPPITVALAGLAARVREGRLAVTPGAVSLAVAGVHISAEVGHAGAATAVTSAPSGLRAPARPGHPLGGAADDARAVWHSLERARGSGRALHAGHARPGGRLR